jgi:hypothetical protein
LLYEYQLGHDAQTAAQNVNRAKGAKTVHQATAYRWFAKFRVNNIDLNDQPRSGRPREIDREAVIETIELDPMLTTGQLADEFGCGKTQIKEILKAAGRLQDLNCHYWLFKARSGRRAVGFRTLSIQVKSVVVQRLLKDIFAVIAAVLRS